MHDPKLVQKIIADYIAREPTEETTPGHLRELSEQYRMAIPKLRGILVNSGNYIAKTKPKMIVADRDSRPILAAYFTAFCLLKSRRKRAEQLME